MRIENFPKNKGNIWKTRIISWVERTETPRDLKHCVLFLNIYCFFFHNKFTAFLERRWQRGATKLFWLHGVCQNTFVELHLIMRSLIISDAKARQLCLSLARYFNISRRLLNMPHLAFNSRTKRCNKSSKTVLFSKGCQKSLWLSWEFSKSCFKCEHFLLCALTRRLFKSFSKKEQAKESCGLLKSFSTLPSTFAYFVLSMGKSFQNLYDGKSLTTFSFFFQQKNICPVVGG